MTYPVKHTVKSRPCPDCEDPGECANCRGTGSFSRDSKCTDCGGEGICPTCEGDGRVYPQTYTIEFMIQARHLEEKVEAWSIEEAVEKFDLTYVPDFNEYEYDYEVTGVR